MALKDWKKIGENRWLKENTNLPIIIYVQKYPNSLTKGYNTYLNYSSIGKFNSKSQALSFAKKYMRTH